MPRRIAYQIVAAAKVRKVCESQPWYYTTNTSETAYNHTLLSL